METEEVKKLSDAELKEKIAGERTMLTKLKLQHSVSPIENPMRIHAQRKLVARLLTEVSFRAKGIKTTAAPKVTKAPEAPKAAKAPKVAKAPKAPKAAKAAPKATPKATAKTK
jgi:large subunit ribosomal protein L29